MAKENKIEELLPGGEEGSTEEVPKEEKGVGETPEEPQKIKIGDQEYTVDQLKEALQRARDYEYLVPEFTRKSQRLAELERQLQTLQATKKELEDPTKVAAMNYLKELGFPTREEAKQMIQEAINNLYEDIELEQVCQYLEQKYDGSHGEPPFNRDEVLKFALENFSDMPRVDLEYCYKKLHEDYWGKLPEKPTKKAPVTERGGRTEFTLPKAKIKFEPKGTGEISVEEAAKEFLKSREVGEEE